MAAIERIELPPHAYHCKSCDNTYDSPDGKPMWGYNFTAETYLVTDESLFVPSPHALVPTLKSEGCWACHDEEGPCLLMTDREWETTTCYAWKCSGCGKEFTFDNNDIGCSAHNYSDEDGAKRDALVCCKSPGDPDPEPEPVEETVAEHGSTPQWPISKCEYDHVAEVHYHVTEGGEQFDPNRRVMFNVQVHEYGGYHTEHGHRYAIGVGDYPENTENAKPETTAGTWCPGTKWVVTSTAGGHCFPVGTVVTALYEPNYDAAGYNTIANFHATTLELKDYTQGAKQHVGETAWVNGTDEKIGTANVIPLTHAAPAPPPAPFGEPADEDDLSLKTQKKPAPPKKVVEL